VHKFSHHNAGRLENPERYELLRPGATLRKFGLRPGMTFIDVGAGTGFFSRKAADIVGADGIVYALDMSPEMLEILRGNGIRQNTRVILSDEYRLPLPDEIGDLTLLSTVLHENTDVKRLLAEAIRVTKDSGIVAIIEWKKQEEDIGPPKGERIGRRELLPALSDYEVVGEGDLNKSHYFVLIRRK
jgi:ubiquinone/menaquinone biosynthesis C-methylase UbiE